MKKIIFNVCLFFVNSIFFAQETSQLHIQHLTDNFYIYTTYKNFNGSDFPSNSMYLVTQSGVVLFDTPWDDTQFQPLLDSIYSKHNKKVVLAIVTHYHDDRTAGLQFLRQQGIKTYSSQRTYDLCKKHNEKRAAFSFVNDTTFNLGNYNFETYYAGEGHTKDNIIIWFEEQQILYGGCLVKSTEVENLGNVNDANLEEWPITIQKIMEKYPDRKFVIPGHFGWSNNKGLEHTLKLLQHNGY